MIQKKTLFLLDAGHGKETAGKRSPIWPCGSQYFEYEGMRAIRDKIAVMCQEEDIPFEYVTSGDKDVSLPERVRIVNKRCREVGTKNVLLISLHSNGWKHPDANGWEVYTTRGNTSSDQYATAIFKEMGKEFSDRHFRVAQKDGDPDKEENFFIIARTVCSAILTENFFHTNPNECQHILMTDEGRYKIAKAHFEMIKKAYCA